MKDWKFNDGHYFAVNSHPKRWAHSANRKDGEVAECYTFKLKNANGEIYMFTPDPFNSDNVWVHNNGKKSSLPTPEARELWKELVASKGYKEID